MSFGAKLIEQRKKHAYSQEQLSDKIGVSRQAISRWEADDTLPDANNLKKLSELFQISIDELLENNYFQERKVNAPEKEQGTEKPAAPGKRLLLPKFLIVFGLLGILTFYVLSTQIPARVMRLSFRDTDMISLGTNEVTHVSEEFYSPREVYAFFPFLHTYHLEGLTIIFLGLIMLGVFLLICSSEKRRNILKSHILHKIIRKQNEKKIGK